MIWRFKQVSKGVWERSDVQRHFFDWLGSTLGLKSMDDWHSITKQQIIDNGGKTLLEEKFDGSLPKALLAVYPEYPWMLWRFEQSPRTLWKDRESHRLFFSWLGNQLGYKTMDDWYNITWKDISRFGGSRMLSYYDHSPLKALQEVYPNHHWIPWKFGKMPQGFRERVKNEPEKQKEVIEWLSEQLSIRHLDDWYRISVEQIQKVTGLHGIHTSEMLFKSLRVAHPTHTWDLEKIRAIGSTKAAQFRVVVAMRELFSKCGRQTFHFVFFLSFF